MSAITSAVLDNRLYWARVTLAAGVGRPHAVDLYVEGLTKAPRYVLAWHLARMAWRLALGRGAV
jgi:hypothetical protein